MGDWRVSPLTHPQGLLDVSEKFHDAGLKLLLWFELERVIKNTPITKGYPEYFSDIGNNDLLLDLGDDKAWGYCFNTLCELIENLKIDCYRQNFNFQPPRKI